MGSNNVHSLLVTGRVAEQERFYHAVYNRLNYIQQRGLRYPVTAHYTCLSEDLEFAKTLATEIGMTLQEIVHENHDEVYPILAGPGPGFVPHRTVGVRSCRVCGCTDSDCSGCIERTGRPCSWVEANLCSACQGRPSGAVEVQR